jgi:hypothetical protein
MPLFYESLKELVTTLNIQTNQQVVIYSVNIPILNANDVLTITSTFECTNNYKYNAQIGSYIVLATLPNSINGTRIDPANAWNITPGMHHGVVVKARSYKVYTQMFNSYINVVGYSSADAAKPGQTLTVEQGYGHLDVVVHGPQPPAF